MFSLSFLNSMHHTRGGGSFVLCHCDVQAPLLLDASPLALDNHPLLSSLLTLFPKPCFIQRKEKNVEEDGAEEEEEAETNRVRLEWRV